MCFKGEKVAHGAVAVAVRFGARGREAVCAGKRKYSVLRVTTGRRSPQHTHIHYLKQNRIQYLYLMLSLLDDFDTDFSTMYTIWATRA